MLMINAAKGSEMLASAALRIACFTGNALGAYLGGLPIAAGFGYMSPQYVGVGLGLTGFIFPPVTGAAIQEKKTGSTTSYK